MNIHKYYNKNELIVFLKNCRYRIWQIQKFLIDDTISGFASSLSFYAIFSIIPILLLTLSIFTSMKGVESLYADIKGFIFTNLMPTNQEIVAKYLEEFLKNSFEVGVIGFVSILYASLMFFYNFDSIVVKMFNTPRRSFWNSLVLYWALVTLMPIGFILAFYTGYEIQHFLEKLPYTGWIDIVVILPYLIIWFLFYVIYRVVPHCENHPKAVLWASFGASVVWELLKSVFVYYVFLNKSYTSIYGSFATVLFTFLWIYFSWVVFLLGFKGLKILHKYYT